VAGEALFCLLAFCYHPVSTLGSVRVVQEVPNGWNLGVWRPDETVYSV